MPTEEPHTGGPGTLPEEEFETRLEALREFDLEPVTERLRREGVENADELEMKFRRFAKLLLERPEEEFGLSAELDEYWHAFILDTVRYHRFCEAVFGDYLHHVPGDPLAVDPDEYAEGVEGDHSPHGGGHSHHGGGHGRREDG